MNNNNENNENNEIDSYLYEDDDFSSAEVHRSQLLLSPPPPSPSFDTSLIENIMSLPLEMRVEIFLRLDIKNLFAYSSELPFLRSAAKIAFHRKFGDCLVVMANIGTQPRTRQSVRNHGELAINSTDDFILVQGSENALMFLHLFGEYIGHLEIYEDWSPASTEIHTRANVVCNLHLRTLGIRRVRPEIFGQYTSLFGNLRSIVLDLWYIGYHGFLQLIDQYPAIKTLIDRANEVRFVSDENRTYRHHDVQNLLRFDHAICTMLMTPVRKVRFILDIYNFIRTFRHPIWSGSNSWRINSIVALLLETGNAVSIEISQQYD